jgi:elongation factor G
MADLALRELERAFLASRSLEDEERWLLGLVRAGELSPIDLAALDVRIEERPGGLLLQLLAELVRTQPTLAWRSAGDAALRLSGPSEPLVLRGVAALRAVLPDLRAGQPRAAARRSLVRPVEVRARRAPRGNCSPEFAEVTIIVGPREVDDALELENRAPDLEPLFFEGVRAGLERACDDGLETGIPFAGISARVIRARTHPVDSSARAFARAARMALEEAVERAGLVLEPWREGARPMGRRPVDPATAAGLLSRA